jgi:hypothetical protein
VAVSNEGFHNRAGRGRADVEVTSPDEGFPCLPAKMSSESEEVLTPGALNARPMSSLGTLGEGAGLAATVAGVSANAVLKDGAGEPMPTDTEGVSANLGAALASFLGRLLSPCSAVRALDFLALGTGLLEAMGGRGAFNFSLRMGKRAGTCTRAREAGRGSTSSCVSSSRRRRSLLPPRTDGRTGRDPPFVFGS